MSYLTQRMPTAVVSKDAGRLMLRLSLGGLLLFHGVAGLRDPQSRIETTKGFGVPFPRLSTWLSILGELATSLGVLVGLLTVIASVSMAILMAVTYVVSQVGQPLMDPEQPGLNHENAIFFCLGAIALACVGAGRFSVDHWLRSAKSAR